MICYSVSLTLVALRKHDDRLHAVMANHPPKVVHGTRQGALRRDEFPTVAILKCKRKLRVDILTTSRGNISSCES